MSQTMVRVIAAVTALALVLTGLGVALALVFTGDDGATVDRDGPAPTTTPAPGATDAPDPGLAEFYSQELDWAECESDDDLECAVLTVPVDYAEPEGDTLRVALLKGVSVASMDSVYRERLRLNPGADKLVAACKAAGLKVLLVSGGFTFFADRVRDTLGIDYLRAHVLEQANGLLTGRMVDQPWGDICDGAEKRKMLLQTCADLGISAEQTIAMGDGANDLPMMGAAGLSVAYHAKPQVRAQAMVAINEGGLDRLLELLT